jgi:MoaA/NifB/PqqE/SkfB family radical SAM enzyme
MEPLFAQSAAHGVSHQVTLLSLGGARRGNTGVDTLPDEAAARRLAALVERTPHVRFFRAYFDDVAAFLAGRSFSGCGAGRDTFNIDHVGNVSPCIEKIGENVGNVKTESMKTLYEKLTVANAALSTCNDCFTACRGFSHELGPGRSAQNLLDLGTRMRRR